MNDMTAFPAVPAKREGTPALISFWGFSYSGKTKSALLVARGIVGPKGKIIVIDTENNRAKMHDEVAAPWWHIDLQPPFTPDRYQQAKRAAEEQGADIIIIDSASHVWEGEGGVIDMADAGKTKAGKPLQGLKKWQAPKMAYKRMMNELLRSKVHVIFCLRAKENFVQQKGRNGQTEIVHLGQAPISEKNLKYEMTVSVRLDTEGLVGSPVKAPSELMQYFPQDQVLTEDTGKKIAEWVSGGADWDADLADLKRRAREAATFGTESAAKHWKALASKDQKRLKDMLPELRRTAEEADSQIGGDPDTANEPESENPFESKPAGEPYNPAAALEDGEGSETVEQPETPADMSADAPKAPQSEAIAAPAPQESEPNPPVEVLYRVGDDIEKYKDAVLDAIGGLETGAEFAAFKEANKFGLNNLYKRDFSAYKIVDEALNMILATVP